MYIQEERVETDFIVKRIRSIDRPKFQSLNLITGGLYTRTAVLYPVRVINELSQPRVIYTCFKYSRFHYKTKYAVSE